MAITQAMCTSFKSEMLDAIHDMNSDTFKVALYTSAATMSAATTAYSATNEASGSGYSAGGSNLAAGTVAVSGTTVYVDWPDLTFSTVTLTARGCLIYNSTKANRAVAVFDFGTDKTATAGDFTIVFPTADASNAVLRFA